MLYRKRKLPILGNYDVVDVIVISLYSDDIRSFEGISSNFYYSCKYYLANETELMCPQFVFLLQL